MTEPLVLRTDIATADGAGLTTLTLNRPDKLNALGPTMFIELREHLDAIAGDESVGCVVLTGAGRAFCAGHDLKEMTLSRQDKDGGKAAFKALFEDLFKA